MEETSLVELRSPRELLRGDGHGVANVLWRRSSTPRRRPTVQSAGVDMGHVSGRVRSFRRGFWVVFGEQKEEDRRLGQRRTLQPRVLSK